MADATKTSESSNNENAISEKLTELFESVLKSNNKLGAGAKTYAENIKNFLENARALHKQFEEAPSKKAKYQRVKACSDLVKTHHGEYVEAPLQMAYVVEKVLEQGSQGKRRSNEPFWLKTFVYNTETGKAGQCMPQAIYDEAVRWQKNPKVQKETFEGIANVFETLINFRDTLKEETRILKALYQPSGNAANTYTDKDGAVVEKEHVGEGSTLSGSAGKIIDNVSIDQCGSAHTAEQCYLHRNDKNEQACLYMPHLRHLNPALTVVEGKNAWEDMKKSVCVDRRAVPFRLERKANEMDQLAVREKKQYPDNKTDPAYTMKGPSDEATQKYTDINSGSGYGGTALKLFNKDYAMYEADSDLTRNGNIVPVFFDVDGSSTFKSDYYNPEWFKQSTFGERQAAAATAIQRLARRTGVTKSSGMSAADKQGIPTKIQAKIDVLNDANSKYKESLKRFFKEGPEETLKTFATKSSGIAEAALKTLNTVLNQTPAATEEAKNQARLAAWRAFVNKTNNDTGRYEWEERLMKVQTALEAFDPSLKGLPFVPSDEIAARTVYEMAKAGTLGNGADDEDIRQLLLFDQRDHERPLVITAKGTDTCNNTLKALHLDFAQHQGVRKPIYAVDQTAAAEYQKDYDGPVYNVDGSLDDFLQGEENATTQKRIHTESDKMKKYEDDEGWKRTFGSTKSEEEILNDLGPVRVIDLPADKKKNMFVMLTAGGDFDHYDDYGNYVGPVRAGGKKTLDQKQRQNVVKGSKHLAFTDASTTIDSDTYETPGLTMKTKSNIPTDRDPDGTNGCLFRMGTYAIMLLKGAAAGGHFTKVQQALKRIYDQMAEGAQASDGADLKTAMSITADEETFLEMIMFPEQANNSANFKNWIDGKGRNAQELRRGVLETLYSYQGFASGLGVHALDGFELTADHKQYNEKVKLIATSGREKAFDVLAANDDSSCKDDEVIKDRGNCVNKDFDDFVKEAYPASLLDAESILVRIDTIARTGTNQTSWWKSIFGANPQMDTKINDYNTAWEAAKQAQENANKKTDEFNTKVAIYNKDVEQQGNPDERFDPSLAQRIVSFMYGDKDYKTIKDKNLDKVLNDQNIKLDDMKTEIDNFMKAKKTALENVKALREEIPLLKPLQKAMDKLEEKVKDLGIDTARLPSTFLQKAAILQLLFWDNLDLQVRKEQKTEDGTTQSVDAYLVVDVKSNSTNTFFKAVTKDTGELKDAIQLTDDAAKPLKVGNATNPLVSTFATIFKSHGMGTKRTSIITDIQELRQAIQNIRDGQYDTKNSHHTELATAIRLIRQKPIRFSPRTYADKWRKDVGTVKGISTSAGKQTVV